MKFFNFHTSKSQSLSLFFAFLALASAFGILARQLFVELLLLALALEPTRLDESAMRMKPKNEQPRALLDTSMRFWLASSSAASSRASASFAR